MELTFKKQVLISFILCSIFFTSLFFYIGDDKKIDFNNHNASVKEDGRGIALVNGVNGKVLIYAYNLKQANHVDHNIYTRAVDKNGNLSDKKILVKNSGKQTLISAINDKNGNILLSYMDKIKGTDQQKYLVYNNQLNMIADYSNKLAKNSHSARMNSVVNHQIIICSEGWINGKGRNDIKSGHLVKVYNIGNKAKKTKSLLLTDDKRHREWNPMIATANNDQCFLLWQRFVNNQKYMQLCYAVYNPNNNQLLPLKKHQKIKKLKIKGKYYNYGVQYLTASNEFIVYATDHHNNGRIYLFNADGKLLDHKKIKHAFIRETIPAIKTINNESIVVYPTNKKAITSFTIANHQIRRGPKFQNIETKALSHNNEELELNKNDQNWNPLGNVGSFFDDNLVVIYSLGENGIIMHKYITK